LSDDVEVVLSAFRAVEQRDREALLALYHPDVAFHDAPSLPYGGVHRGKHDVRDRMQAAAEATYMDAWGPLQPTEAERRMDPQVLGASADGVVVRWRQRALAPSGERFDAPVLGLYGVRDGLFARAQMFHFDTVAVVEFLRRAKG
jgi:ketosteroid isomerase-like protein